MHGSDLNLHYLFLPLNLFKKALPYQTMQLIKYQICNSTLKLDLRIGIMNKLHIHI